MGKLGERGTCNLLGETLEASEVVQRGTKMWRERGNRPTAEPTVHFAKKEETGLLQSPLYTLPRKRKQAYCKAHCTLYQERGNRPTAKPTVHFAKKEEIGLLQSPLYTSPSPVFE
jgi:hypothetical protein